MKNLFIVSLFVFIIVSCQSNSDIVQEVNVSSKLTISYSGSADVVQFKMLGGLNQILRRDSLTGNFEGVIELENLNEAIFTYDIVAHKKDSLGKMILIDTEIGLVKLNKHKAFEQGGRYLWIGENRNVSYSKNKELTGSLDTITITSEFLEEKRQLTIYTPKDVPTNIPFIYFTDGSNVGDYAAYVDNLISTSRIEPIKLIGIHSSAANRYEEYVKGGNDNKLFDKHEKFVFNEVLNTIEKDVKGWEGKRYIYGYSNGAAFSMYAGLNRPDLFEEIVAFSTADYITPIAQMINPINFSFDDYPKFYLGAGKYETSIFAANIGFINQMEENKLQLEFKSFIAGHDQNVWQIEFLDYLENRFGK